MCNETVGSEYLAVFNFIKDYFVGRSGSISIHYGHLWFYPNYFLLITILFYFISLQLFYSHHPWWSRDLFWIYYNDGGSRISLILFIILRMIDIDILERNWCILIEKWRGSIMGVVSNLTFFLFYYTCFILVDWWMIVFGGKNARIFEMVVDLFNFISLFCRGGVGID